MHVRPDLHSYCARGAYSDQPIPLSCIYGGYVIGEGKKEEEGKIGNGKERDGTRGAWERRRKGEESEKGKTKEGIRKKRGIGGLQYRRGGQRKLLSLYNLTTGQTNVQWWTMHYGLYQRTFRIGIL